MHQVLHINADFLLVAQFDQILIILESGLKFHKISSMLVWIKESRNNLHATFFGSFEVISTPKTGHTGQIISSLGKVPIEILPEERHITWVSAVLIFCGEFQMEPLV